MHPRPPPPPAAARPMQDVARYWGMQADELILRHTDGGIWPMEGFVASELRAVAKGGSTSELQLFVDKRPVSLELGDANLEIAWAADENKLSAAEKRRMERQRRELALSGQKAKSKKEQMAEERANTINDLIKYIFFITLYMGVLYSRRTVRDSFELVEGLRTAFVEENFGDFNEKAYMAHHAG